MGDAVPPCPVEQEKHPLSAQATLRESKTKSRHAAEARRLIVKCYCLLACPALLIVAGRSQRWFAHFNLVAHLLDLRSCSFRFALRTSIPFCCCATVDFSSVIV